MNRVRWTTHEGLPFYCHCGPQRRGNLELGPNEHGYACRGCVRRVPAALILRRVNTPMPCCYCDVEADAEAVCLVGHPALLAEP